MGCYHISLFCRASATERQDKDLAITPQFGNGAISRARGLSGLRSSGYPIPGLGTWSIA